MQITEDDLKAAFEKDKDKLGTAERRRVQQISFLDKAAADAAYQKIQSGTDFVALAKELGSSEADIDLGMLKRSEMADATIGDTAFKLEKDKVSEPVTGALGKTVLLRVTEIEPGKVVTFEEAKPELEKKVLKDRAKAPSSICMTASRTSARPAPSSQRSLRSSSSIIRCSIRSIAEARRRTARCWTFRKSPIC